MAAKRYYNAKEVHKLILEESSDSDNVSEIEHDSDDSYVDGENQNAPNTPEADDRSDRSSDRDDESDSTDVYEQSTGSANGGRGRSSSDGGQSEGRSISRGKARAAGGGGGLGDQGGGAGGAARGVATGNHDGPPTTLTSKNGNIIWMKQPVLRVDQ